MTIRKLLAGASVLAAIAVATPAAAQYYSSPYGSNSYGYNAYNNQYNSYSYPYGYNTQSQSPYQYNSYSYPYGYNTNRYAYGSNRYAYAAPRQEASQQCTAAVQDRLDRRVGLGTMLASLIGARATPRVTGITGVTRHRTYTTVTGSATSGHQYAYSPYGVGAYGALGYSYRPDIAFTCTVDNNGTVRNVRIDGRK